MNGLRYADEVKNSSAYKSIASDIDRGAKQYMKSQTALRASLPKLRMLPNPLLRSVTW